MGISRVKILSWVILVLSFIGFIDATYLAIKKFFASPLPCYIFQGCDVVNTSSYSNIFGIPNSLLGAIFYLAVFILTVRFLETKNFAYFKAIFYLSILGFLMALYLTVLQVFVIKALCIYCLISAIDSTLIFALTFFIKITESKKP